MPKMRCYQDTCCVNLIIRAEGSLKMKTGNVGILDWAIFTFSHLPGWPIFPEGILQRYFSIGEAVVH